MNTNRRAIQRPIKVTEDYLLEYVLKFIRNKYVQCLTDQDILNILTKDFKAGLEDKFHFEVGLYMKVIRKTILNYPHWGKLKKITNFAFHLNYRNNYQIKEFSDDLKKATYQVIQSIKINMMPNLQFLKNQCTGFPQMQDIAAALPEGAASYATASSSKDAKVNIPKSLPVLSSARPVTLKCILNWPNVLISLSLPGFQCMRQNLREVSYDLINTKNMEGLNKPVPFNIKQAFRIEKDFYSIGVDKRLVNECLQKQKLFMENNLANNDKQTKDLYTVISEFTFNLEKGPAIITPGEYKMFLNKNKYFRYLFENVPEELVATNFRDKYDIKMEEILSPAQIISFSHVLLNEMNKNYIFKDEMPWLKIHCLTCRKSFQFSNLSFERVVWHFMDNHYDERLQWTCSNCKQTFPAKYLMEHGWCHDCEKGYKFPFH